MLRLGCEYHDFNGRNQLDGDRERMFSGGRRAVPIVSAELWADCHDHNFDSTRNFSEPV